MTRRRLLVPALVLLTPVPAAAETSMGAALPVYTVVPFATLLLAIALLPLSVPEWWEHNRNKGLVAGTCALPIAVYLLAAWGGEGAEELLRTSRDYCSFLVLLGSLFVVSSGIYVKGSLSGTPLMNTVLLLIGALLASFIGTTGASVLLVRPLLRANESRRASAHLVIFFIFIVSNCGGMLTPLGDPPLFLGFLNGVPFQWTFRLWPEWLLVNGVLLVVAHVWDQVVLDREERERPGSQLEKVMEHRPLRIMGAHNFAFLGGIIATVYASGRGLGTGGAPWPFGWQEASMTAIAVASYFTTPGEYHVHNRFTFGPIIEVAVLFAGIFVTMAPALLILNARGSELGLHQPWHLFWASGSLSSFLDNAPTYLTFAATAAGLKGVAAEGRYLATFIGLGPEAEALLRAVSVGAVCMGANTYIGNGPNFMVKAIAEHNGVRMPSFFGYMAYSTGILVPIFVVMTFVFFR
jgi:Na+/H+ antiporter NhaD/arsenite permease-like protein